MHYFGIPTCPYCKKRVNLIRTWSLKRQGEYQCPRCGGISNIYLSPLVYVLALLAVFGAGAMYFFHKFVLDDVTLETALYVFLPFAVFFLFSVFMVYLEKPVIKKVSKTEYEKKRSIRAAVAEAPNSHVPVKEEYYDDEDYGSRGNYRPGPDVNPAGERHGVVNQAAFSRAKLQAAMENSQGVPTPKRPAVQPPRPAQPAQPVQRPAAPQQQRANRPASVQQRPAQQRAPQQVPQAQAVQQRRMPVQPASQQRAQPVSQQAGQQKSFAQQGAAIQQQRGASQIQPVPRRTGSQAGANQSQRARYTGPRQSGRVVGGIETPINQSSSLDRYDDPAYVQRRLQEIERNKANGNR